MTPNDRRYAIIGWVWLAGWTAYVLAALLLFLFAPAFIPWAGAIVLVACLIGTLVVDDTDGLRLAMATGSQLIFAWLTVKAGTVDRPAWLPAEVGHIALLASLPLPFIAGAIAILGARRRAHARVGTP